MHRTAKAQIDQVMCCVHCALRIAWQRLWFRVVCVMPNCTAVRIAIRIISCSNRIRIRICTMLYDLELAVEQRSYAEVVVRQSSVDADLRGVHFADVHDAVTTHQHTAVKVGFNTRFVQHTL